MEAGRPRWLVSLEVGSLLAFAALAVAALAAGVEGASGAPLAAALGAVLGVFVADLLSGLVHWLCDSFGREESPVLGPLLIAGFREHHRDPQAIVRHGLVEVSGVNALALLPVLAAAFWIGTGGGGAAVFAWGMLVSFAFFGAATNAIHLLAHADSVPRFVAWLQRLGLILSPAHHARHHTEAHDRSYCITTGWCDALLDRLELLPRLARRLRGH